MTVGTAFAKTASEVKQIDKTAVSEQVTIQIDKTELGQEDMVKITGTAPKGKPVFMHQPRLGKARCRGASSLGNSAFGVLGIVHGKQHA